MTGQRWCVHCDLDESRRCDGICDACNTYRAKYGHLPGPAVLLRRLERREQARLEAEALRRQGLAG